MQLRSQINWSSDEKIISVGLTRSGKLEVLNFSCLVGKSSLRESECDEYWTDRSSAEDYMSMHVCECVEGHTWQRSWTASRGWEQPCGWQQTTKLDLSPTTSWKWILPTTWMILETYSSPDTPHMIPAQPPTGFQLCETLSGDAVELAWISDLKYY